VPPLQIVADLARISGLGLIVTVNVKEFPVQVPDTGVTV
jgi:hypothetical protein